MSRSVADLTAIEAAYRAGFSRFLRVGIAVLGDREAALDAVQEGFARAIRSRRAFRGEGSLDAWLWRLVLNAARDIHAKRRPLPPVAPDLLRMDNGSHHPDLAGPIGRLPPRQRLILFLRHYADLEYKTIASVLEIEVGTVSATLNAAHSALRRMLEEVPK
jgi:RNA polymerase sigma-70 factor, ECF subfamily